MTDTIDEKKQARADNMRRINAERLAKKAAQEESTDEQKTADTAESKAPEAKEVLKQYADPQVIATALGAEVVLTNGKQATFRKGQIEVCIGLNKPLDKIYSALRSMGIA